MSKYIHYFETEADYKINLGYNYEEPWVSYTEGVGLNYNLKGYEKHLYMPFTIEALTDGIISVKVYSGIHLYYKKTGSSSYSQISGQSGGNTVNILVTAGDEIVFIGDNTSLYSSNYSRFLNVPNGGAQFSNSFDHEKLHLAMHIARVDDINPFSEELAYLAGEIGFKTFPVAKRFLCEHCREEIK